MQVGLDLTPDRWQVRCELELAEVFFWFDFIKPLFDTGTGAGRVTGTGYERVTKGPARLYVLFSYFGVGPCPFAGPEQ